jgi:hypothetical protein
VAGVVDHGVERDDHVDDVTIHRAQGAGKGDEIVPAGRVTFIQMVTATGTVKVLSQSFRVGQRHRGLYVKPVLDTQGGRLTAYLNGRVLQRWPSKLLND